MLVLRDAAAALLLGWAVPAMAQGSAQDSRLAMPASARSAAAAVDAFHAALSRGDTRAALDQLTDDVLVFEAGGVERNKAEYSAHHLAADAEFSKAVTATFTRRSGGSDGRFVWIASEGRTTGTFRGKVVDRSTAETMLLRRIGGNWKIAHIHWSSAAAKPSGPATAVPLLARSVPGNGATVRSPVDRLELHFAPPARLLEVIVAGPEGQMPMMVTAAGDQAHYSLPLAGLGAGTYSVDWRASAGGREDRGTFSFTVR